MGLTTSALWFRASHFATSLFGRWRWLALSVAYLALPSRNYNTDGLAIINRVAHTFWWEDFDPNHFVWGLLVRSLIALGSLLGVTDTPVATVSWLQFLNGGAGLAVLWCWSGWLHELEVPSRLRWLLVLLAGGSFTLWHMAGNIDMYVLMTLCALQSVRMMWRFQQSGKGRYLRQSAFWFAAGLLLHQISILLLFPLLYLISSSRGLNWRGRLGGTGQVAVIVLLLVGVPYLVVAEVAYRGTSFHGIRQYLFHPSAAGGKTDWARLKFRKAPWRWPHAIALGHWNLSWWAAHRELYYGFRQPEGLALYRSPLLGYVLPVGWLVLTAAGAVLGLRAAHRGPPETASALATLAPTAALWAATGFGFTALLNPGWSYYRLLYLFPMLLLGGLALQQHPRWIRPLEILALTQLVWNLTLGILPQSWIGHVPRYAQALQWAQEIGPRDLVILTNATGAQLMQYVRTFTGAERLNASPGSKAVVFPPTTTDRASFALVTAATLPAFYERFYVEDLAWNWLQTDGQVRTVILVHPVQEARELIFRREEWERVRSLPGRPDIPALIEMRYVGPSAAE